MLYDVINMIKVVMKSKKNTIKKVLVWGWVFTILFQSLFLSADITRASNSAMPSEDMYKDAALSPEAALSQDPLIKASDFSSPLPESESLKFSIPSDRPQDFVRVSSSLYFTDTTPAAGQEIGAGYRVINTSAFPVQIDAYLPDFCSTGNVWNSFGKVTLSLEPNEEKWAMFNQRRTLCAGYHRAWAVFGYNQGGKESFFDFKPVKNQQVSFSYFVHNPKIALDHYYFETLPPIANERFEANLRVTNNEGSPIHMDAIGVAIRDSVSGQWNSMNFTQHNISLNPGESTSLRYSQVLGWSNYRIWPSISAGGSWFNPRDIRGVENFWAGTVRSFDVQNALRITGSLWFSDPTPSIGQLISGGYTVYNNSNRAITIDASIGNYNHTVNMWDSFPMVQSVTIGPYSFQTISTSRIVNFTGMHESNAVFSHNGVWYNFLPWTNEGTRYIYWPYRPNIGVSVRTLAEYNNANFDGFIPNEFGYIYIDITNYEPHDIYIEYSAIVAHDRNYFNFAYFFDVNLPGRLTPYSSGTVIYWGNPGPWGLYYATPWITVGGETFTLRDYYSFDSYYSFTYSVCWFYCPTF